MRRVSARIRRPPPRVPVDEPRELRLGAPLSPSVFVGPNGETVSTCLNCPPEHCVEFAEAERQRPEIPERVCPVDAISFIEDHSELAISDACIGCGLCVMRCPYGSLYMGADERPRLGGPVNDWFKSVPPADFDVFIEKLRVVEQPSPRERITAVTRFHANVGGTQQEAFYPLVARLFTALGLPASETPGGDTNNRIDVLVCDPKRSIPVEAKSPTETIDINVKSVQQALENKVVILARRTETHPTKPEVTTLAVGYQYPAQRSDVWELIRDVRETYGVRVGVVSIDRLLELVWTMYIGGEDVREELERLRSLSGAF